MTLLGQDFRLYFASLPLISVYHSGWIVPIYLWAHKMEFQNASLCSCWPGGVPSVHPRSTQSLRRTSQQRRAHLQGSGLPHSDASQFRIRQTHQMQELWHYWNRQIIHAVCLLSLGDSDCNLEINCRGQVLSSERVEPVLQTDNGTPHSWEAMIKIDNLTCM